MRRIFRFEMLSLSGGEETGGEGGEERITGGRELVRDVEIRV